MNWLELSIRIGWAVVYASIALIALCVVLDCLSKRKRGTLTPNKN